MIKTARDAASMQRAALATKTGMQELMFLGFQYFMAGDLSFRNSTMGRVWAGNQYNPDRSSLRVTSNHITEKVLVAAAATTPTGFSPTVAPPRRDLGPRAAMVSQTMEDLLGAGVDACGLLPAAQTANHCRCISDSYGIGLRIVNGSRVIQMNGQSVELPTRDMVAFPVHPTRLILDPGSEDRDLRMHDTVGHTDVWPVSALRAAFPAAMKPITDDQLKTIGELAGYEVNMASLSDGVLFGRYATFSKTKGARVYQYHRKDSTGRFDEMYVAIEISGGKDDLLWANQDDPTSPFRGDGLPVMLLHGHRRPAGVFGIGEVAMMADSQRIVNLTRTMVMRHLHQFVSPKYLIDARWLGSNVSDEEISNRINNAVGGFIVGKPMSTDRNLQPPALMQSPPFNGQLVEIEDREVDKMRADSMRTAQAAGGGVKTHVADSTYQRALQEGDRVSGIRRMEDCKAYAQIMGVILGTEIKHVQENSASTLARLDKEGFDQQDVVTILQTDAYYPTCGITLAESDLVYRSDGERREKLDGLLATATITPEQYFRAMAELDQAVSPDDKFFQMQIQKAVAVFLRSGQWNPLPMGQYNSWVLVELRKALFDKSVKFDPQKQATVVQAIQIQTQFGVQEQIQSNPELVMQQQLAQQEQAHEASMQAQEQAQPPEEEQDQPQTLADLLAPAKAA